VKRQSEREKEEERQTKRGKMEFSLSYQHTAHVEFNSEGYLFSQLGEFHSKRRMGWLMLQGRVTLENISKLTIFLIK
jgi:hypothetical protein